MDGLKRPQSSKPVLRPIVFNSTYPSETLSFSIDFSLTRMAALVVNQTKVHINLKNPYSARLEVYISGFVSQNKYIDHKCSPQSTNG